MTMPVDVIRMAIHERRRLEFGYRGLPRVVEPMVLGIGRKGRWQLRARQVGGQSSTGTVGDDTPKLFDLALMAEPAISTTTFALPAAYERGDKAFLRIDAELDDGVHAP